MPFRNQDYSPEKLAMMYGLLDECVAIAVRGDPDPDETTLQDVRMRLAEIILGAAAAGVEDPAMLKQIALRDFARQRKEG